jgi:hypothetical protein
MAIEILERMQIKNPEAKLQMGMIVPPETLDIIAQHLMELGMDPAMAQQLVEGSLHEVLDAKDQQAQGAQHGQPPQGGGQPGQPSGQDGQQAA